MKADNNSKEVRFPKLQMKMLFTELLQCLKKVARHFFKLGAWISKRVAWPMGGNWNPPKSKTGPWCRFYWSSTAGLLMRIENYKYLPWSKFIVIDSFDCYWFGVSIKVKGTKVIGIDIKFDYIFPRNNSIKDGGSTALYTAYTVDTAYNVDTMTQCWMDG